VLLEPRQPLPAQLGQDLFAGPDHIHGRAGEPQRGRVVEQDPPVGKAGVDGDLQPIGCGSEGVALRDSSQRRPKAAAGHQPERLPDAGRDIRAARAERERVVPERPDRRQRGSCALACQVDVVEQVEQAGHVVVVDVAEHHRVDGHARRPQPEEHRPEVIGVRASGAAVDQQGPRPVLRPVPQDQAVAERRLDDVECQHV
jgi:hypothetical protein